MKKYVCTVCGYIAEGTIPEQCPVCKLPLPHSSRRPATPTSPSTLWASARLRAFLRRLSMVCAPTSRASAARSACIWQWPVWPSVRLPRDRRAYKRYAYEEADHASRFAELLGEVVTDSTKKNLMMRAEAECGACAGKMDLAKKAKALNLDAIHDTVHEMAKDEARHGCGFEGLLKRYFNTEV
mgnify:CR=1 FL=1